MTLLNTCLEGRSDPKIYRSIKNYISIKFLTDEAERIYTDHVKNREAVIKYNIRAEHLNKIEALTIGRPLQHGDKEIISSGVNIAILLTKLRDYFKRDRHLKDFFNSECYHEFYTMSIGYVEINRNNSIE